MRPSPASSRRRSAKRGAPLLVEGRHRLAGLVGRGVDRQPVAGVLDGLGPHEVAPPVELGLRVAHRLGELPRELGGELRHDRVELLARGDPRDEPPLERLGRRDRLAEHDDLARAPVADDDRQPLGRAAGRHRSVLRPDVADVAVVHDDRQVARDLELVAAADAGAVDAGDRRLADVPQPVVHLDEGAHPAPVLARGVPMSDCSSRSAPVQNARSPAPVTTTTATPSSHDACSNADESSFRVGRSRAFRTSGRSIVTVATPVAASRS